MGEPKIITVPSTDDGRVASRRHRPLSETSSLDVASTHPSSHRMTGELRASLWKIVHAFLFAPHAHETRAVTERPAVQKLWRSPPLSGNPARMPEDVAELLESWFSLVEPSDVLEFVESAHDSLDAPLRASFAEACNAELARAGFGHRLETTAGAAIAPGACFEVWAT